MQTNEEKFAACLKAAKLIVAGYRADAPFGCDPQCTWAAVASIAGAAIVGGTTIYTANKASKQAEEQAARERQALLGSQGMNEAFLNESLEPLNIGALQAQSVNSNLGNYDAIRELARKFSDFNTEDTLRTARAAGVDIPAFARVLGSSAMGDITGSYYNTPIGQEQVQNILSAGAPSFSVAANSLYSSPYAFGTGVGENRFIGNYLRDAEQRRQQGLGQLGGLMDFGNSFSSRLNSQTAAMMQSQFVTPDIAIASEAQRRSLGTNAALSLISGNAQAGQGVSDRLSQARLQANASYAKAGQQIGQAAMDYGTYKRDLS